MTKKLITEDTKIIYLTFDDGPSKYTSELLDVLRKYNVKATFFVVNSYYSDILERMNEEGHAVGLHTYTHEYKNIYTDRVTCRVGLLNIFGPLLMKTLGP